MLSVPDPGLCEGKDFGSFFEDSMINPEAREQCLQRTSLASPDITGRLFRGYWSGGFDTARTRRPRPRRRLHGQPGNEHGIGSLVLLLRQLCTESVAYVPKASSLPAVGISHLTKKTLRHKSQNAHTVHYLLVQLGNRKLWET
jgi:hypothetical protein